MIRLLVSRRNFCLTQSKRYVSGLFYSDSAFRRKRYAKELIVCRDFRLARRKEGNRAVFDGSNRFVTTVPNNFGCIELNEEAIPVCG